MHHFTRDFFCITANQTASYHCTSISRRSLNFASHLKKLKRARYTFCSLTARYTVLARVSKVNRRAVMMMIMQRLSGIKQHCCLASRQGADQQRRERVYQQCRCLFVATDMQRQLSLTCTVSVQILFTVSFPLKLFPDELHVGAERPLWLGPVVAPKQSHCLPATHPRLVYDLVRLEGRAVKHSLTPRRFLLHDIGPTQRVTPVTPRRAAVILQTASPGYMYTGNNNIHCTFYYSPTFTIQVSMEVPKCHHARRQKCIYTCTRYSHYRK